MLTPEQITALRDRAGQITDPIVEYLIADIAERVSEAGQLTSSAAYEVWKAQKLGVSQKELKKELQKRMKVSNEQLEQLLSQAAEVGYDFDLKRFPSAGGVPFDENQSLQQILDAAIKQAQEDLINMTQTMGFVGPDGKFLELTDAYQRTCDFAFEKVVTGAQDYNSAVRDATRGLAEKGIRVLDYASGVHRSIEAAARQNVMGGLGIMVEQITRQNHDDLGCDGWEISAHLGSAPDHEPIQGKQYSDAEYIRLNNSLVRRVGTLGCRHDAFGVILGVNEPQYTDAELEEMRRKNEEGITYNGKHYTLYEAEQRQHEIERSVKNRKHRILIDEKLGDKDKLQTDQIRLQLLKQEYSRFSKAANLPMQYERMEAAGFDWKKGKAAEKAAKHASKNREALESSRKNGIISNEGVSRPFVPEEKQPSSNRLPNAIMAATDQNKIQRYVLNSNHPHGKEKARVFNSVLGYHFENWGRLSDQIFDLLQTSQVSKSEVTKYGIKYVVPMRIYGERGKSMVVNTVWQFDNNSEIPRLITMTFDKRTIRRENSATTL